MKSILLHIADDDAFESRFQVALDLCRAHDAHLTCLQVMPYNAYVAFDPLGGVYAIDALMADLRKSETVVRERVEARLSDEDVRWDWATGDGDVVQMFSAWSCLSDLLVASHSGDQPIQGISRFGDAIVMAAQCPVLLVPAGMVRLDAKASLVIGWNASPEAARAMRMSLPLIKQAESVHILTVGDDGQDLPQLAASTYLSRHGVSSVLHSVIGKGHNAEEELMTLAHAKGASIILMGAYGRSRLREAILGGVTRSMLDQKDVAVLMMH